MKKGIAIEIKNVSKRYRLGIIGTGTLSYDLKRWWIINIQGKEDPFIKIGEKNIRSINGNSDYVWALNDINIEIKQGDVVGIIGKNGAGKSTLLKILSRVTKPTNGSIKYRGRIASLLEVGTGFHPELTGRENIYMNGAIMGMTRSEINNKLDEIISFAGVERYIDTPVKRYSSGMTVRLGFSIAAHLEPDILVVDEVLAVGDAEFQKKAIGKMQDVSKGGERTVLFVSHNMSSIQNLCKSAILIEDGIVKQHSTVNEVIASYIFERKQERIVDLSKLSRVGLTNINFLYTKMSIASSNGKFEIVEGDEISIDLWFNLFAKLKRLAFGVSIQDSLGNNLIECRSFNSLKSIDELEVGEHKVKAIIKPNLKAGMYNVSIGAISKIGSLDYIKSAYTLIIESKTDILNPWYKDNVGLYIADHKWEISKI